MDEKDNSVYLGERPYADWAKDRYSDIKNPPEDNPHKSLDKPRPVKPKIEGRIARMGITGKKYKITDNGEFIKVANND